MNLTGLIAVITLLVIGLLVLILVVMLQLKVGPKTNPQPGNNSQGATDNSLLNWIKSSYPEDWFKVSVGGVVLLAILGLLNHNLLWWLFGHHPRLGLAIVLLIALGILVLQKNYVRTRKWIWRAGLVMVVLFGFVGAISEDTEKDEPSLGHSLLRESQREAVAEVKEDAVSVYASYKHEAHKGISSYSPPPPPPPTSETKDYPVVFGRWNFVEVPGGWTKWKWSTPGKVMIYDQSWKLLHDSRFPGSGELGQIPGFWVQSANHADTTITLTRVTRK